MNTNYIFRQSGFYYIKNYDKYPTYVRFNTFKDLLLILTQKNMLKEAGDLSKIENKYIQMDKDCKNLKVVFTDNHGKTVQFKFEKESIEESVQAIVDEYTKSDYSSYSFFSNNERLALTIRTLVDNEINPTAVTITVINDKAEDFIKTVYLTNPLKIVDYLLSNDYDLLNNRIIITTGSEELSYELEFLIKNYKEENKCM